MTDEMVRYMIYSIIRKVDVHYGKEEGIADYHCYRYVDEDNEIKTLENTSMDEMKKKRINYLMDNFCSSKSKEYLHTHPDDLYATCIQEKKKHKAKKLRKVQSKSSPSSITLLICKTNNLIGKVQVTSSPPSTYYIYLLN